MANDTEPKYVNQLFKDLADNSTGPVTQRTILYGWDPVGLQKVKLKVASDGTLATSASLSGGGGDGAILDGVDNTIKATVKDVTGAKALAVAVVDASGNQITSFGGGTGGSGGVVEGTYNATLPTISDTTSKDLQLDVHGYLRVRLGNNGVDANVSTPGDANANDTGIVAVAENLMYNGSTWDRVRGDTTNGLFVQVKTSALPTGAATAAKQPALGTAGSASSDVITVQGIASMTALKVDGSGVTQPVSGTFWQATQPISATSLPLPTGAATAAKQPALGTAGTASSDVITVQGIASMTALKVDGSAVTQPVSGTVTATLSSSTNAGATAKTSDYDTGAGTDTVTMMGIALPASGGAVAGGTATNPIQVSLANTGANSTAVKVDGSAVTQPVSGTVAVSNSSFPVTDNSGSITVDAPVATPVFVRLSDGASAISALPITDNSGSITVDNGGTFAVQATLSAETTKVIGTVNIASSQSIAVTQATGTNLHTVIDSGTVTTVSTVTSLTQMNGQAIAMGTGVRSAGTQRVTIATDDVVPASQSGTWTVQPGNTANTTPWLATITPGTTGGWSVSSLVALSNTKTQVKSSAGTVGGYMFYNPNASVVYIQVYNVANASVTVGTTTPTYVIPLPASSGANVEFTNGINHSTAINVACTTTATGSTAPGTAVDGFMLYK